MNNSPTRYKRRPAAQRRELILAAAARLIAEHGYDHTTVDDIAREAGVSKGAVYLHWDGKESLFDDLLRTEMQRTIQGAFNRIFADPDGGLIGAIYRHSLLALQANPLVSALYTRQSRILGDFMQRQDPARYTGRFLFALDFVTEMQSAGLVRSDLAPNVIATMMAVMAYGFIGVERVIPPDQAPTLDELAPAMADMAQNAFGAPGADAQRGKQALATLVNKLQKQVQA